jgi:hypothetical protein
MKTRCYNPNTKDADNYINKGIEVCKEWRDSFEAFMGWALAHGYDDSLTIERVDASKDYCPSNCEWITSTENSVRANSKPFKVIDPEGNIHEGTNLKAFCKSHGLHYSSMWKVTHNARKHHKNWRAVCDI